jgi:endonuclease-3
MYPEKEKNPLKVERILVSLIDPAESSDFCHRIVQFGRDFCRAQSPRCDVCPLGAAKLCQRKEKKK